MLINEQHIVLEARVEVRLETQLDDDRVVVAVDVCVDAVQPLEHVSNERGKGLGESNTNARGEHGFVVDIRLYPRHEVLNVLRRGHLRGLFVGLGVLPEVFKSGVVRHVGLEVTGSAHSSVAFISGQVCGEQNSVMEP